MARRKAKRRRYTPHKGAFSVQFGEIINEVTEEVKGALYEASDTIGEQAAQKLKATSPRGETGSYADGWEYMQRADGGVVYNATDYQLTHLLEFGHVVRPRPTHKGKKRRVEAKPHIATVEQWANQEIMNTITRLLS